MQEFYKNNIFGGNKKINNLSRAIKRIAFYFILNFFL